MQLVCLPASQGMIAFNAMGSLPLYVLRLWAFSVLAQLVLLLFLFLKGNFRKLPFFAAYVALNICQAGFVAAVYSIWGTSSATTTTLDWYSETLTLVAAAFATTEVLKVTLEPYKGIWGLAWRFLTAVSTAVVILVVMATHSTWAVAKWFQLERGYNLTFASAVIACLLLVRYYSIAVPAAYRMILGGFCFYACTDILINTILQALLKKQFYVYQPIWQSSRMLSFVAVQVLWTAAVWKPLPIQVRPAAPPSDSIYGRLSPEINERLRDLNEKLLRLWKLEARSQ
jgi:hypothetical protein